VQLGAARVGSLAVSAPLVRRVGEAVLREPVF